MAERAGKVTIKMPNTCNYKHFIQSENAACLSHILQNGAGSESLP